MEFDDFLLAVRKRKILSMCQFSKKFTVWNVHNMRFRSLKNLCFLVTSSKYKFFELRYCACSRFAFLACASWIRREVEAYFSPLRRKGCLSGVMIMEMHFNLWFPPLPWSAQQSWAEYRLFLSLTEPCYLLKMEAETIRQQALSPQTSWKHSSYLDMEFHLRLFFQQSVVWWEIPRLLDDTEFHGMSAGVHSNDQGISCRFLRTVLLTCSLLTCPLKCSNGSQTILLKGLTSSIVSCAGKGSWKSVW